MAATTVPPDEPVVFDAITIRPPSISWFHNYLESTHSTASLLEHILAGTAVAVSDGSFSPQDDEGACAWIVACPDASEWISGGGMVPEGVDSYRAELAGQIGIASFLEGYLLHNPALKPVIKCCCDGVSALNRTGMPLDHSIRCSRSTHADFVSILSSLWPTLLFVLEIEWVKGRQDDLQRPLTVIEHLNCWMDSKAKRIVHSNLRSRQRLRFHPTTLGLDTITIDDSLVYIHIQQPLYRLGETLEVDTAILQDSISWSTFLGKARKSCPLSLSVFVTKQISNTGCCYWGRHGCPPTPCSL